jgi:heme exporter protein D
MMADYFAMGGYAAFVWPAYGVTIVGLAYMLVASLRSLRQAERRAAAYDAARGPRRAARRAAMMRSNQA